MARLVHGTTRFRAEQIVKHGPNPRYREPGGVAANDGFSMYLEAGPYMYYPPEHYARGKASQCPNEGGPVILMIEDVPDDIIAATNRDGLFPPEFGVFQFDVGAGIEELMAVWESLPKHIRPV